MTRLGDIMAKIKNSNGEVSMTIKTMKTPKSSGWLAKVSRVLIFTMVSVLSYQVYYAYASIGSGQMVYNNNTTTPQARTYTVSSNTFAAGIATAAGGTPSWIKVVAGTVRYESVVAYVDTGNTLRILYWNGSAWSAAAPHNWTAALGASGASGRGFDIAVEKLSGDIIVAYTTNAAGTEINSYRWDGSTWTGPTAYDSARLTGTVRFIKMESKPNSDDIGLIMADTNNDLSAAIWTGTTNTFGNPPSAALSTSASFIVAGAVDAESFDLAYESQTGDLLVVWANDAIATGVYYNTFSGGAWGTTAQNTNITEAIEHLDCAADPLTNNILCAFVGTATQDMRVGVWSGTAWQGTTTDVDTTAAPGTFVAGRRYLATGWLNAGSAKQGIVVYNDNNANAINWVTVAADGTFAVQTDNTAATPMPVGGVAYHDIIMDPYNPDILLYIFQDTTNFDIFAKRLIMDSAGAFTWSDANAGVVIDAAPTTAASEAFHFAYDLYLLAIDNGTNPSDLSVGESSTDNALDSFTMQMKSGSGTVTSLVVTGSTNFTSTNIPTNGVKVWRDLGTLGVYDPGVDVQISSASTAIASNATTVTISSEAVTTTLQNYLVTVDITAAPTYGQTFTGTVTTATASGIPVYNDTSSATLTVTERNLTVSNGTNPVNKNAQPSSVNNALDGFSMVMPLVTGPTTTVTSLTVTGSANFTSTNIPTNGVKVWRDTGTTVGWWDAGDVLVSSASTAIASNATTVTINSEAVTTTAQNYLVTVDITAGATLAQTFTGTVTAAAGTGLGTPVYADSSSATLTVNKLLSANASCGSCHAYPPYDGTTRDGVSGAFVGDHQKHNVVCLTCHVAPATETSADFKHRDGNITMQAAIKGGSYSKASPFAQVNNPVTGTCSNISCHGGNNPTPQWGVGTATCISCHSGIVTAANASIASGGTVTQRDAVKNEFGLAWGHKNLNRLAVTDADCIVCHLEGNWTTQKTSAVHADGYINLRAPDGAGEVAITDMSAATYSFVQFSTTYAAGSRTQTGNTSNNVDNVLTQKFCLACHDSNGATNTTARSNNGGTGTATMPFGGVALGLTYTAVNDAIGTQGLIDVKSQVATSNSSFHPVVGPLNRDFPAQSMLNVPYNNNGSRPGTSGTKTFSVVLNCFDCHNQPSGSELTKRTVISHGSTAPNHLRGNIYSSTTPICTVCHSATYATGTSSHPAGSAWGVATSRDHSSYFPLCNNCHLSTTSTTAPTRPIPAQDIHGFNRLSNAGSTDLLWPVGATESWRPYGFLRNTVQYTSTVAGPRPYRGTEAALTTGTSNCGNDAVSCDATLMTDYAPGGSY